MSIADFIEAHVDRIVSDAEQFSKTLLPAAGHLDAAALRDHLPMILDAIAKDLRTAQSPAEEVLKSHGHGPLLAGARETAAQTHAMLRAKAGFDIKQMVSEYRALRASVLRLWLASGATMDAAAAVEIVRFNEAIDQAVAESVSHFTDEAERWRNVFLAVLGHDLRGPLNAVLLTAEVLAQLGSDGPTSAHAQRLMKSGKRMRDLLDSLLDYSRSSLGEGIAIERSEVDLAAECRDEVEMLREALPGRRIELMVEGSARGRFDGSRVREALGNLVYNAAAYGSQDRPISVRLSRRDDAIVLSVENDGPSIPAAVLPMLFEPLRRGAMAPGDEGNVRSNLGLGLFVVQAVAKAHGGDVRAASRDGRTQFTLTLPAD